MADDEINLDKLIGAGVDKVKKAEEIHAKAYIQAKAKNMPKADSSDAEVRKYIGTVIAQYRADARAGGVGKGKVNEADVEIAFAEVRSMAERLEMTPGEFLNKVRSGDYQALDQIQRSHSANELDNLRTGHYHMHVEPHGSKISGGLAAKLGSKPGDVLKDLKGHYAKAHNLAKEQSYLK